ncbi:MAG TPA: family 16 glycoside hydrolase, partial [Gemmataceae bacterium]|nr:family 16 glycoside hydrolase [Gemmataceae bacterium]
DHFLRIKRGDLEFETDKFILKKGDTVTLKVELLPGKVQVVSTEGKVIGEKTIAPSVASGAAPRLVVQAPSNTPFAPGNVLRTSGDGIQLDTPSISLKSRNTWTVEAWVTPREPLPASTEAALVLMVEPVWISLKGQRKWALGGPVSRPVDTIYADGRVEASKPVHLAMSRGPQGVSFFVNGVREGEPFPIFFGGSQGWLRFFPPGNPARRDVGFNGDIHEARVSSVERYQGNFTPKPRFEPDADTIALYHFDEGQGDTIKDASGHGHDGKILGAKWVKADGSSIAPTPADGSVSLFNGKDLTGWKVLGHPGWTIKDGVLIGETAAPRGWLMSDKDYADFELSLEYMQSAGGNSGVFLRAWPEGPVNGDQFMELQLIDDSKVADPKARTGALFDVLAPSPPPKATINQWHRLDIRLLTRQLQVNFDGQKILATNLDDHRDLFSRIPGLNKTAGRIGLQLYPGRIEFKNIRVRELVAGKAEGLPPQSFNGWGQFIDPNHDCQVAYQRNKATISLAKGVHDMGAQGTGAPRLLQDLDGDFTIQVKVGNITCPADPNLWASGGLLIWKDEKEFIRLERVYRTEQGQLRQFCFLYAYRDGKPYFNLAEPRKALWADLGSPQNPTLLRLERLQGRFYPSVSEDGGKSWKPHPYGSFAMDLPAKVKAGADAVGLSNHPITVQLEDFSITRSKTVKDYGRVVDPVGDSKITTEGYKLVVQIPGAYRDLQAGGDVRSPRVLQEVNGDFVAQVKIANLPRAEAGTMIPGLAGGAFHSGGLLVWKDDQNFFRFEHVSRDVDGKVLPLCWLEPYLNGDNAVDPATKEELWVNHEVPDKITHLRVERKQDVFYLSYSQDDGKTWLPFGKGSIKLSLPAKLKVGLSVVNNTTQPLKVEFENFQIVRSGSAPAGNMSDPVGPPPKPLPPPPDLSKTKPIYEDRFANAKSGWNIAVKGNSEYSYDKGRYFLVAPTGRWSGAHCPHDEFSDFACEVVGRLAIGQGGWALQIRNPQQKHELRIAISKTGTLRVTKMLDDGSPERLVGPIQNPAIKDGGEWNNLLVIGRRNRFEIYVNGVMVCEPFESDFVQTPAKLGLVVNCPQTSELARAEFTRFTVWSAQGLSTFEQRRDQMTLTK